MSTEQKNEIEETEEQISIVEDAISLEDVVREQQILEEDARAVLGGSDDGNCTYDQGYIYRQALYSCLTCVPKTAAEAAGVCLACCLQCHEGHELVELYTKRNFRCDCGNGKFGGFACRLEPNKDRVNEKNKYSHNFVGEYCICNRPYPDPEDAVEDEMYQCIVCEDWFHGRHLDAAVPAEFSEMICQLCVSRCPFLRSYGCDADECSNTTNGEAKQNAESLMLNGESTSTNGNEQQLTACKYFNMSKMVSHKGAVFFASGWREQLCRCEKCLEMYETHNCAFLMDNNDTVDHYEEMGKMLHDESCDTLEKGMRVFNQQDRVTQIEQAQAYNELKHELTGFLRTFAEKRKIVGKEDIDQFFDALRAKKRSRVTLVETCGSSSQ